MKKLSLPVSILSTLAYSNIFQYPLTENELKNRLIGTGQVQANEFSNSLKKLIQIKKIKLYWVFKGYESDIPLREKRAFFSRIKLAELQTLISRLKKIPLISSVYVTGSLAMNNVSSPADDIDVLIVTKPGMMWLTRLIVVLWTSLIGKYRLHGSSGEWGWCFNLWLDQNHLEMPKEDRSVYSAYEVVQAKLILGTQNELLRANGWVSEYISYPVKEEKGKDYKTRMKGDQKFTNFHFSFFKMTRSFFRVAGLPIEELAYFVQRLYMQPKRSREKVGRGYAFFHPRDTKNLILKSWQQKLEELGIGQEEREVLTELFEKGVVVSSLRRTKARP